MPADLQIAEYILGACLDAGHKPGKVQFTKYLYQLDYCHYRFTGKKATTLPWKFYHYGPWCEEAEECMATLANRFGFSWRETEPAIIRDVEIPRLDMPMVVTGLTNRIIDTFKDKDLNVLLDVTYSQTEPMIKAHRGEELDFSAIPVTRTLPEFFPASQPTRGYQIPQKRREEMARIAARADELKKRAQEVMRLRQSPEYLQAMEIMRRDLSSEEPLPELKLTLTAEAVDGISRCD